MIYRGDKAPHAKASRSTNRNLACTQGESGPAACNRAGRGMLSSLLATRTSGAACKQCWAVNTLRAAVDQGKQQNLLARSVCTASASRIWPLCELIFRIAKRVNGPPMEFAKPWRAEPAPVNYAFVLVRLLLKSVGGLAAAYFLSTLRPDPQQATTEWTAAFSPAFLRNAVIIFVLFVLMVVYAVDDVLLLTRSSAMSPSPCLRLQCYSLKNVMFAPHSDM